MSLRVKHRPEDFIRNAVRPVFNALAPLVLHDVTLGVDHLRRHRVEEISHPIGFEEERELERVRRNIDPVVRPIVLSRSVVVAACAFEPLVELSRLHVAGAHEHQVLEQMGEAGAPGPLARRADVIPHVDRDEWHGVILVEDYGQAVRQPEQRVLQIDRWRRGRHMFGRRLSEAGRCRQQDEQKKCGAFHCRGGPAGPPRADAWVGPYLSFSEQDAEDADGKSCWVRYRFSPRSW